MGCWSRTKPPLLTCTTLYKRRRCDDSKIKSIGAQSTSHAPHRGWRPSSHQATCFLHAGHFLLLSI